jgi:predicted Zn finger-like uncharacterized protein
LPRYECPRCRHRFRVRGGIPGEVVRCSKCGTVVYTFAKAVKPMVYPCPTCGTVFPSEAALEAPRASIEKGRGGDGY